MSASINNAIRGRDPDEDLLGDLRAKVAAGAGTPQDAQLLDDALIFAQAQARRFRNPDLAVRGVDRSAIQRNAAGIPTNLGDLVHTLGREIPQALRPTAHADAGAGFNAPPEPSGTDLTKVIRGY